MLMIIYDFHFYSLCIVQKGNTEFYTELLVVKKMESYNAKL